VHDQKLRSIGIRGVDHSMTLIVNNCTPVAIAIQQHDMYNRGSNRTFLTPSMGGNTFHVC